MKTKEYIAPGFIAIISIAVAIVAMVLLVNKSNNTSMLLKYLQKNDQKYVPVLIHTSQMLWLYNGVDYCLVKLKNTGHRKFMYDYRFYDGKLKKETTGSGEVSEYMEEVRGAKYLKGNNRIKAGSFDFMWSPGNDKDLFCVYIVPGKFDMRVLIAGHFSKYPYYDPEQKSYDISQSITPENISIKKFKEIEK